MIQRENVFVEIIMNGRYYLQVLLKKVLTPTQQESFLENVLAIISHECSTGRISFSPLLELSLEIRYFNCYLHPL